MAGGRRIEIRGTVQGVGFRPWVYRVARELGVVGRVRNDPRGVTIEAFGDPGVLDRFVARLEGVVPGPAAVHQLEAVAIPGEATGEFVIEHSGAGGQRALSIPPDLATCPECEAEVLDPNDRRFGYAFTNCTHCGPRFTIAEDIPYDRPATTMAGFEMCPRCRAEYEDVGDRRFHAQPNACPVCGPKVSLLDARGAPLAAPFPLLAAAYRLRAGEILAVKGLGGFHLACDATRGDVVSTLRHRKRREQKPFAVMVRDVDAARELARLSAAELALLCSAERPIVLVTRRPGAPVAREVAPDTDLLGVMLPYTPLHHLLLDAVGGPLVMTSANRSDEPICCANDEAIARMAGIVDAFVVHDRPIASRCDDSVAHVVAGAPVVMRRSRGFVPRPIRLGYSVGAPVLALGAQLKNTFCLASGDAAYLGPHIGDLESVEALDYLEESIERMCRMLAIEPEVIAHDLHPDYASTRLARRRPEPIKVGVQHHHAHVVSAIAEHRIAGSAVGVAFDGTGYGTDGTSWGGEIVIADASGYDRLASFRPVRLAGGDTAIREVWRIAVALLEDAYDGDVPPAALALVCSESDAALDVVRRMVRGGFNSPRARGVGRYFDGAGALGLGWSRAGFEGQVAVAWDRAADNRRVDPYPYDIDRSGAFDEIDLRPAIRALAGELIDRGAASVASARFHATLIDATAQIVRAAPALPVVLTGGVFHNARLATGLIDALRDHDVYLHRQVPPGDGGIALGQALIADAVARRST